MTMMTSAHRSAAIARVAAGCLALSLWSCGSTKSAGGTDGGGGGTGGGSSDAGSGGSGGRVGGGGDGGRNGSGGGGGQGGACAFSTMDTIVESSGLIGVVRTTTLSPPASFRVEGRSSGTDAGTPACAPALPACHDATHIDVSDIEAAIANADVQAALAQATRPAYGERAVADAPDFAFTRAGGRGFNVGVECTPATATCTPTPTGVHALVQLLRDLITQQLADPTCAAFPR